MINEISIDFLIKKYTNELEIYKKLSNSSDGVFCYVYEYFLEDLKKLKEKEGK